MICLLVMTDGRMDCAARTIPSALEHLHGPITRQAIHDDSGDPAYFDWLKDSFPAFDIVTTGQRSGFGGAYRHAWQYLTLIDERFVFNLEDDFTFNRPVDLADLAVVLDENPNLVQLALRRQPWNDEERAAGGVVEQHPDAYEEMVDHQHRHWLEHRLFFTTNPSLHRTELCERGWPDCPHSEGVFSHQLLADPEVRFGFWGARDSGEWVEHIGNERAGVGY